MMTLFFDQQWDAAFGHVRVPDVEKFRSMNKGTDLQKDLTRGPPRDQHWDLPASSILLMIAALIY